MSLPSCRIIGAAAGLAIAAVSTVRSDVPVMEPIADMETTVTIARHDETVRRHVYASNAPTTYAATGFPPNVNFMSEFLQNGRTGVFYWENGRLTGGLFTVSVTATNADGTSAPATFRWAVHPGMIDFIYTERTNYVVGDVITFKTTYSAPVVVTGTPYLQLWGTKRALYASGSGTDKLTFTYQVAADDPAVSGYYVSDIAAGDGAIATVDGVSASLHDTYHGLGYTPTFSIAGAPTPTPSSRLVNLSSRAPVWADETSGPFIAGFVVGGYSSKRFLLRAAGPALGALGIAGPLANPKLQLFDRDQKMFAENDDWSGSDVSSAAGQVGAFALEGGSRDAAMLVTLAPGPYTFRVVGNGGSGVALAEVYDATGGTADDDPSLVNISSRGYVGTGEAALIAGFVVTGGPKRFLIRGVGPGLAAFGVGDALSDPTLTVYRESSVVARNDDWGFNLGTPVVTAAEITAAGVSVGAFDLKSVSKDAATIVTLPPGAYTAVMTGVGGATGSGLVEVYALP